MKHVNQQTRLRNCHAPSGLAAVEMAVCLPVLVLIMVGAIESSNMIFLRQAMVQSSYEAAKLAARPDGTSVEATDRAAAVLAARGIENYTVNLSPANTAALLRGTDILATVTAPMDSNRLVPFTPFAGQSISVSMTSVKH